MNSPDMNRLAAALAKLDDPDIIALLLEAYTPTAEPITIAEPTPLGAEPVQEELLGHIQDRSIRRPDRSAPNANRFWTQQQIFRLRAMYNGNATTEEMAQQFGRTRRSIETAIQRHVLKDPRYQWRNKA